MILKSTITFLLAFYTSIFTLQSQPNWFPDNGDWYYFTTCFNAPDCGYTRYYSDGDSLIGEVSAKVLRSYHENSYLEITQSASHYFYFADDTVFYYSFSNEAWGMLYDFNAQPGDVWDLTETLADYTEGMAGEVLTAIVDVDSVTEEMVGGEMRKLIYTSPQPLSDWEFKGPILEGVGPIGESGGLLGDPNAESPSIYLPHFSCYRDDGVVVVGSDDFPCGVVSNVHEEELPSFTLFPNPTTSHVRIELQQNANFPVELVVYNIAGQMVKSYPTPNFPLTLDLSDLPAGLYVLQGETTTGKRMTTRIVKSSE